MQDLKENIENEVHAAREEYVKMESHIRLYINEMEQCITWKFIMRGGVIPQSESREEQMSVTDLSHCIMFRR